MELERGGILTSTNDTTILAMLSRYPDLPPREIDEHISNIENEENVSVCKAVVGRMDPNDLELGARRTYEEFHRWSLDRTRRFRNEQISAREQSRENREATRLIELHQQGVVSDQFMLMYGIQGDLPERNAYFSLSDEEKLSIWTERMERRFGPNWRQRFHSLPSFMKEIEEMRHDWKLEGF